ncbi:autotransporter domain-containing protein [Litorimonas haliclonae]|uniref:autotransporter domain-containing protein n=1 Tax=Litorimonas haliclonae TaxID=2081977 RepID=UPI0039EF370E
MSLFHPYSVKTASRYLGGACSAAIILGWGSLAFAQVTIEDDLTDPVDTATAGADGGPSDVTITSTGSVTVEDEGPAVTLNSNNDLINEGEIQISDVNDATAVSLEGGADRNFTNSGSITLNEDFPAEDTNGDNVADGPRAQGSGRTGILISGASPFEGNVTLEAGSTVTVEGNDSYGVNITDNMMTASLDGNLSNAGQISLIGDNGAGVNIAGDVTGNITNTGSVSALGEGSNAYNISGDVQGGFVNSGSLGSNGFRLTSRPGFQGSDGIGREDLTADNLQDAGSSVSVSGNITGGMHFAVVQEPVLDEDDNETGEFQTVRTSNVTHFGSAPAIVIDGNGVPISIGRVSAVTDPTDENFDESLQFAFVNEGSITSQGLFDDFDATVLSIQDAELEGGLSNSGTLTVSAFSGTGLHTVPGVSAGDGYARVIVLGDGAIVEHINNTGVVSATASEPADEIYADQANPITNTINLRATAIDISSAATTDSLYNRGSITSVLVGRSGEAFAIRDASGSLSEITNEGLISATGRNSDTTGVAETNFTLVALDASANTSGFTYTQQLREDDDPDDDIDPVEPQTVGDIRLGSGDDLIVASAGSITGDIDFGSGQDTLTLSGGSTYTGLIESAGEVTLNVSEGSTLALTEGQPLSVANASFDGTSSFIPTLNGATGSASTLNASGTVSFGEGATISPRFNTITNNASQDFTIANAALLDITEETLNSLNSGIGENQPFLYNFDYSLDGSNTLIVTVDLRDPNLSIEQGGLGLDSAQAAAFAPALEAFTANSELGTAIANITNGTEFNQAFNQLLPEFSAAAREFVLANVDGATGAVGSHLDTARRSPEKPGGAWIQEFAYFADRDLAGLSEQYRGEGFGFTGGLDTAFGPFHAVGVNFGFASTEIEDVVGQDEPLDVITLQTGLYAGYAQAMGNGELGVELYAGGGYNKFEQERRVLINNFFGRASADYSGYHINGSARFGYDLPISSRYWMRPAVSFDYLRLSEDGYTEDGTEGVALDVGARTTDRASAAATMNFGAEFQGKRTWIRPSVRFGYRYAFLNDPALTEFGFAGLNGQRTTLDSFGFPDSGFIVGFSVAAGSEYSSIGFDLDSDIRDGFIRHTGRVVVRLLF